jgi:hypothetical protein
MQCVFAFAPLAPSGNSNEVIAECVQSLLLSYDFLGT